MKITFVLPVADLSGGVRVVRIYAEELQKRGHEVTVVSTTPAPLTVRERVQEWWRGRPLEWRIPPQRSHLDGAPVRHLKLGHPGPVTADDVPDADVIIATWWETAEWVARLPAEKGLQAHFMQDYETWGGPAARVDAAVALPLPKIVIARWVEDLLAERFEQTVLARVPNAVDARKFTAPPRGKQAQPTVGFTYQTFLNKGADLAIAACTKARQRLPALRVLSFGPCEPIDAVALPEWVDYHLRVPDAELPGLYASCDAWLFATRREGFGLPILEAMACRTPVLATPAGAAPELIGAGGGILVAPEDPDALADAIVEVAHMDDAAWRTMSDRAWRTAHSYSWQDATDLFEQALQGLCTAHSIAAEG